MELRPLLESLLAGEFICQISHPDLYQQLQDAVIRSRIEGYLEALGRQLSQTEGQEVYHCAYSDLSQAQDARQVRQQFECIRDQIGSVLHFLILQMKVEHRDTVLILGDTIHFHHLLASVEQEPAYQNDLRHIGRYELFKKVRGKSSTQERLVAVLEVLEKEGYIVLTNRESSIYQVTGKIEYFYHCLEFIKDHEQAPLDQEDDDQRGINLDN